MRKDVFRERLHFVQEEGQQSNPSGSPEPSKGYTVQEWRSLLRLRGRYRRGEDTFSERELGSLFFMRWLRARDRLPS